jgi:hypothetical protein
MPKPFRLCVRTWLLAAAVASLPCTHARAETPPARDARQERLDGFSKDDLTRLAPEIARGPVALVEFADSDAGQLPAINIAVEVHANAQLVTRVLADPASFPRFMPTLDTVAIVAKHEHSIVYDWSFDLALLHLRGRNLMTIYPAPAAQPDAASRITIDNQEGDLGRGRSLFRVHPRGENSLLVLSLRLDLREANFVARQVAKAARSVNRSANLALAFSMALHVRNEAERLAGFNAPKLAAASLEKPAFELARLTPLLNRGDLLFFRTRGAQLDQIAVVGAVAHPEPKVRSVMHDAKAFGSSLVPGSKAEVTSVVNGVTSFDWEIALPLVGVSGQMRMRDDGPVMTIDASHGALEGGRWLFELTPVAADTTLVTGWARFDFNHSTWLLEKLVSADAYLGQGIIGSSQVMLLRAVRSRAAR